MTTRKNNISKWLYFIFIFAILSIILTLIIYFYNFNGSLSTDHQRWGTFGDFMGGTLNPILSFISLIALLITLTLQSKELEASREELERSATAQEKSENSLKKQSDILIRQQFEQTFFSLLEQHNATLENISTPSWRLMNYCSDIDIVRKSVFKASSLNEAKDMLEEKNGYCGHYFRILYQLLKFIATNIPGGEIGSGFEKDKIIKSRMALNEKMYSNIVRSFLSYDLSQLLAINCYCAREDSTYWRYKLLLERYEFLEHMPFEINKKNNKLLLKTRDYYSVAFGKSIFIKYIDIA
ncbi:putative phage abortive infection protein [Aeromonas dhakensis]|uniref:putative phage abortive infection protein n=1 Tax=Aeromonas dhakensis TaxID=196024 RepID=UPI00300E1304